MNARQTHAVVAAGLQNPALLDHWLENPGLLEVLGIVPGALDLATLRKFTGLTLLVRHNALREDLPRTFRLLSDARLEIELFADYAAHIARNVLRLSASAASRASELADFVASWMNPDVAVHRRLHDLIRHEATLATLAMANLPHSPPTATMAFTPKSVPVIEGTLILHTFSSDPRGTSLEERDPVSLGYWRSARDTALHIVELDVLGYELLAAIDGHRTAGQLAQDLLGKPPSSAFLDALDTLAGSDVIRILVQ